MNFCAATVDALCFHLADGDHLTGTLAQPFVSQPAFVLSVAQGVRARRSACSPLIIKSSALARGCI